MNEMKVVLLKRENLKLRGVLREIAEWLRGKHQSWDDEAVKPLLKKADTVLEQCQASRNNEG